MQHYTHFAVNEKFECLLRNLRKHHGSDDDRCVSRLSGEALDSLRPPAKRVRADVGRVTEI